MSEPLKISVTFAALSYLYGEDLKGMLETARIADSAGIDQIVVTDHLAIGSDTAKYPYGRFPFGPEEPWPEPLTTLAAVAGATERIRLGTGVLIAPLRPPVLLAKAVSTLDALSGGRVDLGVGVGWQREEFQASGVPFEGRGDRMDSVLLACRALWTEAPASFRCEHFEFEDLWCLPRPVQAGGIPIWFGLAPTPKNARRIAELGAGWMPILEERATITEGIERLRSAFSAAGRDPAELGVRVGVAPVSNAAGAVDLDATLAALPELAESGATVAAFALPRFVRSRSEIAPFLERLGAYRQRG